MVIRRTSFGYCNYWVNKKIIWNDLEELFTCYLDKVLFWCLNLVFGIQGRIGETWWKKKTCPLVTASHISKTVLLSKHCVLKKWIVYQYKFVDMDLLELKATERKKTLNRWDSFVQCGKTFYRGIQRIHLEPI